MIKIDQEICIGCGTCPVICEEVFEMRDDGKAHVKAQKDDPNLQEAIDSCPVECITK